MPLPRSLRDIGSGLLPGLLLAAAFAPLELGGVAILALGGLALAVLRRHDRPWRAALSGFGFGLGWFTAGVGWLFVAMHRYGGMHAALAATAVLLFAAFLAIYPALACGVCAWLSGRHGKRMGGDSTREIWQRLAFAPLFAACFTGGELLRGWVLTGFPWISPGYAQIDNALAGYAPIFGVYGVGFFAALLGATIACVVAAWRRHQIRSATLFHAALVAAGTVAIGAGLGRIGWSQPVGEPIDVKLVQGNIDQAVKFDPDRALQAMDAYVSLVTDSAATLVVLPETAWIVPIENTPPENLRALEQYVRESGAALAIGAPDIRRAPGGEIDYRNTVQVLDRELLAASASGSAPRRYSYTKHHLVPFGEFVPFGFRWFVDRMNIPLGDMTRGDRVQPNYALGEQRIAFDICYEDLFGEELIASLHDDGTAGGATILANVTNIAWYGDSHALPQHLQISRMRALELARPMIRATNTGTTAAIDHEGQVIARLPTITRGTLTTAIQGRTGFTPYARAGNLPIIAICVALMLVALIASLRRFDADADADADADERGPNRKDLIDRS